MAVAERDGLKGFASGSILYEHLQSRCHIGDTWCGSFGIDAQARLHSGLGGVLAQNHNHRDILVAKLVYQRSNLVGAIEDEDVVVRNLQVAQIGAHGVGKDEGVEVEVQLLEGLRNLGVVGLGKCQDETLVFMLEDNLHEAIKLTVGKENLALAIDYILLEVERYRLGNAEVLHRLGYGDACLFANAEKVVDGRTASENYGRVVENFGPLATKLLERHTLYTHKGFESELQVTIR